MYLLDKIIEYRDRFIESKDKNEDIAWSMNNCLEEFIEILAYYSLNCKI